MTLRNITSATEAAARGAVERLTRRLAFGDPLSRLTSIAEALFPAMPTTEQQRLVELANGAHAAGRALQQADADLEALADIVPTFASSEAVEARMERWHYQVIVEWEDERSGLSDQWFLTIHSPTQLRISELRSSILGLVRERAGSDSPGLPGLDDTSGVDLVGFTITGHWKSF